MQNLSVRTAYMLYHVLLVVLSLILCCNSLPYGWGNIKPRYGLSDDATYEQEVRMPGITPDKVSFLKQICLFYLVGLLRHI